MHTLTSLIVIFFIFISSTIYAIEPTVNFSGTWSLNSDKTLLQGKRTSAQGEMDIRQEENSLTIKRISPGRQEDTVISIEELPLDGQEKDIVISGKRAKLYVSWSTDGKKMTIFYIILFAQNDTRTTTEVWELSEDGKTLSINYTSKSSKGTRTATYVYDKQ